jgi:acetyl-CoA acetyltransferase
VADQRLAGARVIAARQAPYRKKPANEPLDLLVATVADAVIACGLRAGDVDGLAVASFQLPPDNVVSVAEHLGLTLRWAWQGAHGGASGVIGVLEAAEAITAGRANVVVCAAADSFSVASHNRLIESFNSAMREYLAPYGFGGANGLFALVEREHRERFGTTRSQLGKIAVEQRRNAQRNPNALLTDPLNLGDYLSARVIADPIRLYDCVMPCEGADVVVLTSAGTAQALGISGVSVLAGAQRHNHLPAEILSIETGAATYRDELFEDAGINRSDLDLIQLYDDYPIMVAIQLEDLGFAAKGEAGAFLDSTDLSITGDLPLNTGGGQLSCGQAGASGGMIGMFEAVTQLLGDAAERQVPNAELALVSGFGMVGYGKGLSSGTVVLGRS